MKEFHLRYVASVVPITGILDEYFQSNASTIRDLLVELDAKYGGFREMFADEKTGKLNIKAMIYYAVEGKVPNAVIDLDQPLEQGAKITFW